MLETWHMLTQKNDVDLSLKFHSFLENKDVDSRLMHPIQLPKAVLGRDFELFGPVTNDLVTFCMGRHTIEQYHPSQNRHWKLHSVASQVWKIIFPFEILECSGPAGYLVHILHMCSSISRVIATTAATYHPHLQPQQHWRLWQLQLQRTPRSRCIWTYLDPEQPDIFGKWRLYIVSTLQRAVFRP